jgi:bacterioferritin (cytochrome b1)
MGGRHSRLAAALAAAWEAEVVAARVMTAVADKAAEPGLRARLLVLAAFSRAHASRLLARLASLGRGPLPVPPDEVEVQQSVVEALRAEAASARQCAIRYEAMAAFARSSADVSTAWVCELNRAEEDDRASELSRLAEAAAAGNGAAGETRAV